MANITIPITEQDLVVKTDAVEVLEIGLSPDNEGFWNILVRFNLSTPERPGGEVASLNERHEMSASTVVSRAEIAAVAGIPVEDVRTTLTLDQTQNLVTQIAMGKILSVAGLTA